MVHDGLDVWPELLASRQNHSNRRQPENFLLQLMRSDDCDMASLIRNALMFGIESVVENVPNCKAPCVQNTCRNKFLRFGTQDRHVSYPARNINLAANRILLQVELGSPLGALYCKQ